METFGDLLTAVGDRKVTGGSALDAQPRSYDYRDFQATVYKTGNLLRHQGVSDESTIAVLDQRDPEPIFALLGAGLLGAAVRIGPTDTIEDRVLFGPTAEIEGYETAARTRRVGYGSPPDDPSWVHFERDMWSENPAFPETPIDPTTTALVADHEYSQETLLDAAVAVSDDLNLDSADRVAIRAPLADPGTVVAGVLAPLVAGSTILLPDEGAVGTVAVTGTTAPESRTIAPGTVEF